LVLAVPQKIRTLLFSTLYPSSVRPLHGIFVETRLRELLGTGAIETKVVAPVPWFPSTDARWGSYAKMAETPRRETHHGIDVLHPRYPVIPKIGMTVAPLLLALSTLRTIRSLLADGFVFDLIDAHYYYPDGVAAAILARWLDKPLTVTARGTDLNLISRYALPRRMIQWTARQADASIGVSRGLMQVLRDLDIDSGRLHVMRNGVDLLRFHPLPRAQARSELGLVGSPLLLAVGNLIELKGHHLVIDALESLRTRYPAARLVVVGQGPERLNLEQRARERGVADRVTFAGAIPNEDLVRWYSAADVLVLASQREGWPNVLLEAMACGTPVVATAVGAAGEIVEGHVGLLVADRSAASLAAALNRLLADPPSRTAVRTHAESFAWQDTSEAQLSLFRRLAQPIAG
jgi:teichuronic acid biosynthesis glycosyltransferase TuaC